MSNKKVSGVLLDCNYDIGESGEAIISLFVSNEKKITKVEDHSFRPYFYIITRDPEKTNEGLKEFTFGEGKKILESEEVKKDNAQNVIKVSFRNPQELVQAREVIEDVEGVVEKREYDIPFAKRYLIDRNLKPLTGIEAEVNDGKIISVSAKEVKHEFRTAAVDLETYSPGRFSDPKQDPIIMAVLSTEKGSTVYTYKKIEKEGVVVLNDEKELLEKLLSDIREFAPDILVTYNGDSFDLPYIKERCERLKVKCDLGFGGIKAENKGIYHSAEIKGTQHLDAFILVKFMARIGSVNLIKFDLENVSEKIFGNFKEKLSAEDMIKLWDKGELEKIVEYNREDGEVTLRLATEFMPLQLQLSEMLHTTLYETSRATSSQMVEQLLIIRSFERNTLIPNKPTDSEVHQRSLTTFEGGFVKEPVPGLHENIAVLDFRSLHPSIIIAHNISPETYIGQNKGENVSPEGDSFSLEKKGFLPEILSTILADRSKLKRACQSMDKKTWEYKIANARQHGLKILLNSHYGYLGYPRSRWYSRECAKAVTSWSRKYIQDTMEKAQKAGFKPVYGDTDSSFILVPDGKGEKEVKEFVSKVNAELPEAMELELEGMFKRGIFVTKKEGGAAKKKYALMDYEGNLKIRGFEYVRRDWAPIAKNTQKLVIEAVLKEGRPEEGVKIAKNAIKRLKEGKVMKKDLVVMTQLKRKPENYDAIGPHVAAAKKAIARGKDIDVGSILGYIITKSGKSISDKAELEEYVSEGNYDADYYIEHQILPAVLKITSELGYGKDDLIHGGKQTSLFGKW